MADRVGARDLEVWIGIEVAVRVVKAVEHHFQVGCVEVATVFQMSTVIWWCVRVDGQVVRRALAYVRGVMVIGEVLAQEDDDIAPLGGVALEKDE